MSPEWPTTSEWQALYARAGRLRPGPERTGDRSMEEDGWTDFLVDPREGSQIVGWYFEVIFGGERV